MDLSSDNRKLVEQFGAQPLSSLKKLPEHLAFHNGLLCSHRDFKEFYKAAQNGERIAIVTGVNASGTLHLGHKAVFDTVKYFQHAFGAELFIPISDDESYVSGKVDSQAQALDNSLRLARELLAYGFDPKKTRFIIDQVYTDIYNLAFLLSKKITQSVVKATYGYSGEDNIGLQFYPAVQAAHVLFPQHVAGVKHVLVPIGPDEDAHLRVARDVAPRAGLAKPAVLHTAFLPGTDGEKMSKTKNNAIFLSDHGKGLKKKVMSSFSGGKPTVEEHREHGGDPDVDVACQYLKAFYLSEQEADNLFAQYRKGDVLSGEVKQQLLGHLTEELEAFQKRVQEIDDALLGACILKNAEKHVF